MTKKEFLDAMEVYYTAYYEDEEGLEHDDVVAVVDLALTFYEQNRTKRGEKKC